MAQQQQQLNVSLEDLKDIPCECGSLYFGQMIRIKHVSMLQSPDGKESRVNVSGLVCVECGRSDTEAINLFRKKQKEDAEALILKK
jgi:hypothetical protein